VEKKEDTEGRFKEKQGKKEGNSDVLHPQEKKGTAFADSCFQDGKISLPLLEEGTFRGEKDLSFIEKIGFEKPGKGGGHFSLLDYGTETARKELANGKRSRARSIGGEKKGKNFFSPSGKGEMEKSSIATTEKRGKGVVNGNHRRERRLQPNWGGKGRKTTGYIERKGGSWAFAMGTKKGRPHEKISSKERGKRDICIQIKNLATAKQKGSLHRPYLC